MLGLKLNHVSKRGHWYVETKILADEIYALLITWQKRNPSVFAKVRLHLLTRWSNVLTDIKMVFVARHRHHLDLLIPDCHLDTFGPRNWYQWPCISTSVDPIHMVVGYLSQANPIISATADKQSGQQQQVIWNGMIMLHHALYQMTPQLPTGSVDHYRWRTLKSISVLR